MTVLEQTFVSGQTRKILPYDPGFFAHQRSRTSPDTGIRELQGVVQQIKIWSIPQQMLIGRFALLRGSLLALTLAKYFPCEDRSPFCRTFPRFNLIGAFKRLNSKNVCVFC